MVSQRLGSGLGKKNASVTQPLSTYYYYSIIMYVINLGKVGCIIDYHSVIR